MTQVDDIDRLDEEDLFCRIEELITKKRLYTDPHLNRETLANKLGSNRTYVSRAMRQCAGQTLSEYLKKVRIDVAVQMMQKKRFSLWAISIEVGYVSYSTFYRDFKSRFGVSPNEYLRIHGLKSD